MLDTGRSADRSAGSVFRKCVDPRRHDIRRRCSSCHWNLLGMSGHLSRIPSSRLHRRAGLSEGDEGGDGLADGGTMAEHGLRSDREAHSTFPTAACKGRHSPQFRRNNQIEGNRDLCIVSYPSQQHMSFEAHPTQARSVRE